MSTEQKHALLYTDAGHIAPKQVGGWGIHGYIYTNEEPKKGTGNAQAIPTAGGYITQKEKGEGATLVSVHNYVDGIGPLVGVSGSDETELKAVNKAMEWMSKQEDILSLKIISDSKNVMSAAKSYLQRWKADDWKNSKGNTVAYVNDWKILDGLQELLKNQGKHVTYEWIKGHAGNFGNEIVHNYATNGNSLALRKSDYEYLTVNASTGYWNPKVETTKVLSTGRWYFSTNDHDYTTSNGETIYYIGDHGKDDEHLGKPSSDASMTVLFCKKADPVLETIRSHCIAMDTRQIGSVMIGRLDYISVPKQYKELLDHGVKLLHWDNRRKDLFTGDDKRKQLLKERNPPALAMYAVAALEMLQSMLERFLSEPESLTVTNVTDQFFTDGKLNSDITLTLKSLPLEINYNLEKRSDKPVVRNRKLKLVMGTDLPGRNAMNHAAGDNPELSVITWRESSKAFRYATVLKTDNYVGIWASTTSNLILVPDGN